jgi:hypothetical protein
MQAAHLFGITRGLSSPNSNSFFGGVSVWFKTGAKNGFSKKAVIQEEVAVHLNLLDGSGSSVSTKIALIRQLLNDAIEQVYGERDSDRRLQHSKDVWQKVVKGKLPVVINVDSADIMVTLLNLKKELEENIASFSQSSHHGIKMVFESAKEAHLVVDEIVAADVGIILTQPR